MSDSLLIKTNGVIDVCSARRVAPVVPDPKDKDGDDIVTYVRKDKVTKVGEGEDDYVVEEIVVEESRVNRDAYITAQCEDIGVMAILEKVRRSGDVTLFNQTHAIIPEGLQDYTEAPASLGEALDAIKKGDASFAGLKEIFGDVSFNDLANMSADQIQVYLKNYLDAQAPKKGENE